MEHVTDITDVEWKEEFYDDHELCLPIRFRDQSGTQHELTLWWCGPDGYAEVKYANDCQKAKDELIKTVNDQIDSDNDA